MLHAPSSKPYLLSIYPVPTSSEMIACLSHLPCQCCQRHFNWYHLEHKTETALGFPNGWYKSVSKNPANSSIGFSSWWTVSCEASKMFKDGNRRCPFQIVISQAITIWLLNLTGHWGGKVKESVNLSDGHYPGLLLRSDLRSQRGTARISLGDCIK